MHSYEVIINALLLRNLKTMKDVRLSCKFGLNSAECKKNRDTAASYDFRLTMTGLSSLPNFPTTNTSGGMFARVRINIKNYNIRTRQIERSQ